jgi:hypothetical protein
MGDCWREPPNIYNGRPLVDKLMEHCELGKATVSAVSGVIQLERCRLVQIRPKSRPLGCPGRNPNLKSGPCHEESRPNVPHQAGSLVEAGEGADRGRSSIKSRRSGSVSVQAA